MLPPGQEFVEFFLANILLRLHGEVEHVFPAGHRLQRCLVSLKRATRGHARCNLGNPIPTAGGIRVIRSFRTCSDKLRGPGTSSTRRCRTLHSYEEKLSTFSLSTVTHFMDPAILQTVDIQLFGNTDLLHTELQYRSRKIRLRLEETRISVSSPPNHFPETLPVIFTALNQQSLWPLSC
jgi:hypothetical protein